MTTGSPPEQKHYFVDEAGDPTLFGSRGNVLVGSEGCSRYFILGLIDASDPRAIEMELEKLRADLLADPYFNNVPSMLPEEKKTALFFHAKDDLPEVRREVFKVIAKQDLRFSAVVRDKSRVLAYVRGRNETNSQYRYNPNELYDFMVRRLFKERLHKCGAYEIHFAKRGNSDRTSALTASLQAAQTSFRLSTGIEANPQITIIPSSPLRSRALQVADYCLWALQRAFERNEDRFLRLIWDKCSLVIDADDTRSAGYGEYYTRKKPLTAAAIKAAEEYRSKPPR